MPVIEEKLPPCRGKQKGTEKDSYSGKPHHNKKRNGNQTIYSEHMVYRGSWNKEPRSKTSAGNADATRRSQLLMHTEEARVPHTRGRSTAASNQRCTAENIQATVTVRFYTSRSVWTRRLINSWTTTICWCRTHRRRFKKRDW